MRFLQMGSSWSQQGRQLERDKRRRERKRKQQRRRAWVEHPVKTAWKTWGPLG